MPAYHAYPWLRLLLVALASGLTERDTGMPSGHAGCTHGACAVVTLRIQMKPMGAHPSNVAACLGRITK
eukprot:1161659-Pelagomonas_calceolata.AAC.11